MLVGDANIARPMVPDTRWWSGVNVLFLLLLSAFQCAECDCPSFYFTSRRPRPLACQVNATTGTSGFCQTATKPRGGTEVRYLYADPGKHVSVQFRDFSLPRNHE